MKNKYLKINDLVSFELLNPELVKIKDEYEHSSGIFAKTADNTPGLRIKVAATHAGIITGNNMLYLPDKMKRSVKTFVQDYLKPVLLYHDDHKDPIGRVVDASYVDTTGAIRDMIKNKTIQDNKLAITDQLLSDFCNGSMPFGMEIDFARHMFCGKMKDGKYLCDSKEYNGLGFAQIICNITDSEATQKFLDGRYLTGSVGASTDAAVCSVCKQDWMGEDGECEHLPGAIYDDMKMVLIAGNFTYEEWSVANRPADKYSSVLELHTQDGTVKNIEIKNEYLGNARKITLGFPQYNLEEKIMDKVENKQIQDTVQTVTTPVVIEPPKVDPVKTETVVDNQTQVKTESDDEFIARVMDAKEMTDEENDKLYELMWEGMDEIFKDAKLSTAARKKLASSTFCGPGKSFPVPDCAHVTAARRLITRYKGPGDKSKILACVSRKAKAMGCDSKTKDNITHARMLHMITGVLEEYMYSKQYAKEDSEPALAEADVKTLTNVLKNLAVAVTKDGMAKALTADIPELRDVIKTFQDISLLDEIMKLEEALGKVRDELKEATETKEALTEEYNLLQSENETLRDENIKGKSALHDAKIKHLTLAKVVSEGKEPQSEEMLKLTDNIVDSELEKLNKDIDIKKLTDKLNDGTSRIPRSKVENPMSEVQQVEKKVITVEDELAMIASNYYKMLLKNSYRAEQYRATEIARLQREGKLPVENS